MKKIILTGATIILLTLPSCKGNTNKENSSSEKIKEPITSAVTNTIEITCNEILGQQEIITQPDSPSLIKISSKGGTGAGAEGTPLSSSIEVYEDGTIICETVYLVENNTELKTRKAYNIKTQDFEKIKKVISNQEKILGFKERYTTAFADSHLIEIEIFGNTPKKILVGAGYYIEKDDIELPIITDDVKEIWCAMPDISEYYSKTITPDFKFYIDNSNNYFSWDTFKYSYTQNQVNYDFIIKQNQIYYSNDEFIGYKIKKIYDEDLVLLKNALVNSNFISFQEQSHIQNPIESRYMMVATNFGIFTFSNSSNVSDYALIDEAVEKLISKYFPNTSLNKIIPAENGWYYCFIYNE